MTQTQMYDIGIKNNLDRARIRKLFVFGLIGAALTGAGDFLLGFGEEVPGGGTLAESLMANAVNLSDAQLIVGALLGVFGILLEGLACFGIYRLMADAAPRYAHILRSGIFGYIWLAPVGCHMNIGILNIAYKQLLALDPATAVSTANTLIWAFYVPVWVLLVVFWLPVIVVQFMAFAKGLTPYPTRAKWFCVLVGAVPALVLAMLLGPHTAWGAGIGTMFLSFGNAWMFGGLLATMPSQARFNEFAAFYDRGTEALS